MSDSQTTPSDTTQNDFSEQIAEIKPQVYAFIRAKVNFNENDADDVFGQVMMKGWKGLPERDPNKSFSAWVFRIATNTALTFMKKQKERAMNKETFMLDTQGDFSRHAVIDAKDTTTQEEMLQDARKILAKLPPKLHDIFLLHHFNGWTHAQIAEVVGKSETAVRKNLAKAKELIKQHVRDTFANGLMVGISAEHLDTLSTKAFAKALELYPEAATIAVTTATTAASQTVTGTTVAETAKQTLLGFCAAVALPFLWIMSLLIGSHWAGDAFVRNAPTLQARRWLVKHLLICYSGIVVFPFLAYCVRDCVYYSLLTAEHLRIYHSAFNWIVFGSIFLYLAWLRDTYRRLFRADPEAVEAKIGLSFHRLEKSVWIAFGGTTLLFVLFLGWFVVSVVLPQTTHAFAVHPWRGYAVLGTAMLIMLGGLAFHCGTILRFHEFLTISRNEETFRKTAPSPDKLPHIWDISTILLCVFAIFTIAPSVLHLLLQRKMILFPICDVVIVGSLWCVLFQYNLRNRKHRELRSVSLFIVLLVIMQIIRDFFFVG